MPHQDDILETGLQEARETLALLSALWRAVPDKADASHPSFIALRRTIEAAAALPAATREIAEHVDSLERELAEQERMDEALDIEAGDSDATLDAYARMRDASFFYYHVLAASRRDYQPEIPKLPTSQHLARATLATEAARNHVPASEREMRENQDAVKRAEINEYLIRNAVEDYENRKAERAAAAIAAAERASAKAERTAAHAAKVEQARVERAKRDGGKVWKHPHLRKKVRSL
jgi:hypothetical protein